MNFIQLQEQLVSSGRQYDIDKIESCYLLANEAHNGQKRRSGEDYIEHPISVGAILVELGMDDDCICASLLHDVVEDTDIPLEAIKTKFGEEVAMLVDGVTKLGKIHFSSIEEQQAENLRKMLLAMSKDIRVMIIKLCDRLHNMRTMQALSEQKRRDKALETMEVYAPIAYRLGMKAIKEELEDKSLIYLDPIGYDMIVDELSKQGKDNTFIESVTEKIRENLVANGITNAAIESRVKSVYGIYRKMFVGGKDFEDIYDIYALRIIVDSVGDCYHVLGVIHEMFHPVPNRFKDYISTPKPNLYQSLHTTVVGARNMPLEIQIRSWDMHRQAEIGVAAHWKYKAGLSKADKQEERLAWVRQLLDSGNDVDSSDLLRNIKKELLPEEVYVFTPKGEVISLPVGAIAIDFAYAIHSAIGNRMIGAKVDNRIVPIDHKVINGEIIEVILGPQNKGPSRDWLNIVKTGEAKSKIRTWFKKERKEENIIEGKTALEKEMKRNMINIPTAEYDAFMNELFKRQKLNSLEELYASIGYGGTQISRLMVKVKEEYAKLCKTASPTEIFDIPEKKERSSDGVVVDGIDNCLIKLSKCCSPVPGDDIVGFITRGFGVSIHKASCINYISGKDVVENAPRWISAHWAKTTNETFKATIDVVAMNREGLFADVSAAVASMRVQFTSFNGREISGDRVLMTITIAVQSLEHLNSITGKIKKLKNVLTVERV